MIICIVLLCSLVRLKEQVRDIALLLKIKLFVLAINRSIKFFLEPEGQSTSEYYVQGLSTSMPEDVQLRILRSVPGLEKVEMMRTGYAIEYDAVVPTQLWPSLETKLVTGLFTAGQINGTSGYEEAAGQGVMAGINAARKVQGKDASYY